MFLRNTLLSAFLNNFFVAGGGEHQTLNFYYLVLHRPWSVVIVLTFDFLKWYITVQRSCFKGSTCLKVTCNDKINYVYVACRTVSLFFFSPSPLTLTWAWIPICFRIIIILVTTVGYTARKETNRNALRKLIHIFF